jgi:HAD superfamily hydrolase (TIGR01549 family)
MPIRGVVFDLGHTLMHLDATWPQIFARGVEDLTAYLASQEQSLDGKAFAQALLECRAAGFARAKETMREVTAAESMRRTFAQFGLPDPDPELLSGAIDAFFAYEDDCWSADPVALSVLGQLAGGGMRLGMFSNATHDVFIQRLVDRFGFRRWLDPVLTSAGTGIRKPDPAAFAPILETWALPAQSLVVVGDTLDADILGAQRAGMRSVWLRSRQDARQEGSDRQSPLSSITPDATIDGLGELPGCLDRF